VRAEDDEAILLEFLRPSGPNEKGYVTASLRETRPEVTAYCACADYENLHVFPL
jgi:hypothetical protein